MRFEIIIALMFMLILFSAVALLFGKLPDYFTVTERSILYYLLFIIAVVPIIYIYKEVAG
jgi:hypothetical protein